MRNRLIATIVVLMYSVCLMVPAYGESQRSLNEMQKQQDAASRRKKEAQSELKEIRGEQKSALKNKKIIDEEATKAAEQYEDTCKLLEEVKSKLKQKETELTEMEKNESDQMDLLTRRARAMYEKGSVSYLEVLLSAKSFSDFISRMEIVKQIVDYDKKILNEIQETKDNIARSKEGIEKEKENIEKVKARAEIQKIELNQKLAEQEQFVKKLEADEKEALKAYQEAEAAEKELQEQIRTEMRRLQQSNTKYSGIMSWPLPGYKSISSGFSMRVHPVTGQYKQHTGIDIPAPKGTSVQAASDGTVIISGWNNAYGNYIVIDHGGGIATLYGHNSQLLVSKGDVVKRGQVISKVGSTGYSTGNHLHFEVTKNGNSVNPLNGYVSPQ